MRAVLDPNVLVSALLSRTGAPARILSRWVAGEFELVVSELLFEELGRALGYAKIRTRIPAGETAEFLSLLRQGALVAPDAAAPSRRSSDCHDDYLLGLAEHASALLVSGDQHLLELADRLPVLTARAFLEALDVGLEAPGSGS